MLARIKGRARGLFASPVPTLEGAHPLLGHAPEFQKDPLGLLARARDECGDVARLRLGPQPVFVLSNPDHIHHVLVERIASYSKETKGYRKIAMLLGQGLLTSEGQHWRRQRRLANPAFRRDRLQSFADVMVQATGEVLTSWEPRLGSSDTVDVAEEMSTLTLRIVCRTLFSSSVTPREERVVADALAEVLAAFERVAPSVIPGLEFLPSVKNTRTWKAAFDLERVVKRIIADRRRSGAGSGSDLLSFLMAGLDDETGRGMNDQELRDEVITLFLAGHETTANALAFSFYLLSRHPEVDARLGAELGEVLDGRLPTAADVSRLQYTGQVVREAMRLYPPAWAIARYAREDDVIGGFPIPRSSYVFVPIHAVHHHPRYWPDPERFDPDRFSPENEQRWREEGRPRFAYMPFSGGQRQCIGDRFALMEATLVLATLASRVRMEPAPGFELALQPSVTLRPRNGLSMRLWPRTGTG